MKRLGSSFCVKKPCALNALVGLKKVTKFRSTILAKNLLPQEICCYVCV